MCSITSSEDFYYKCDKCQIIKKPNASDTMLFSESKGTDLTIHAAVIYNASRDPMNPKAYRTCNKCQHNMVRQIRIPKTLRMLNICIKCANRWLEGLYVA